MNPSAGEELRERYYDSISSADRGEALRRLGLRGTIHPDDVWASLFPSQEVADLFAASNLENHGHPDLGSYPAEGGVVGVCDLRHAFPCVIDPELPDDWNGGKAMAGKAVPSSAGGGPRDFSAEVSSHFAGREVAPPEAPPLGSVRAALLRRIGNILRGDWSMSMFDGRDVKRWIDTALDGDADALRELGEDLRRIEED